MSFSCDRKLQMLVKISAFVKLFKGEGRPENGDRKLEDDFILSIFPSPASVFRSKIQQILPDVFSVIAAFPINLRYALVAFL